MVLATWSIQLYSPGQDNQVVDALSQLPLPDCPDSVLTLRETIFLIESLKDTPINNKQANVDSS